MSRNLRGLLERGVQKTMDPEEPRGSTDPSAPPIAIEAMLGYAGSVAVVLIKILKILWSNPAVLPFFDQALSETSRGGILLNLGHWPISETVLGPGSGQYDPRLFAGC
jgi:hypothetical protein